MSQLNQVETLDLQFMGQPRTIASYVLCGGGDVVLVESGPGSTIPALREGLAAHGLQVSDLTHILLTHIHLDHAGAAGQLAKESGATVYVHHVGERHLLDPSRLWRSATRIYGEEGMATLWGEMHPVPAAQLISLKDNDTLPLLGTTVTALDTPGHATHHMSYLVDGLCFTGDVGGVRIPGFDAVRIPSPPPEFQYELWQQSLARIREAGPSRLFFTHFGEASPASTFLDLAEKELHALVAFLEPLWKSGQASHELVETYLSWAGKRAKAETDIDDEMLEAFNLMASPQAVIDGVFRYFKKRAEQV